MLVSTRPSWGRVFRQIGVPLTGLVAWAGLISAVHHGGYDFRIFAIPDLPLSLLGAALGILLGFRTNSAYDRWWEARTLWGGLINLSRTWARQMLSLIRDESFGSEMIRWQIGYVHALRCHLRKEEPWKDLQNWLPEALLKQLAREQNVPAAILHAMGRQIAELADSGALHELRFQRLDQTLTDLTNVQGGCERIKNTPLPRQYDYFPEFFIYVYCGLLPLGIVQELGLLTPAPVAVIGMVFLILNRIGKNLEDPFDTNIYGTPMTALSRTIEINLLQQMGSTDVPSPITPTLGILP